MTDNTNPGNFANRPKEEVQEIASKGGQASHTGGFASMDPQKQVSLLSRSPSHGGEWWRMVQTNSLSHTREKLHRKADKPPADLSSRCSSHTSLRLGSIPISVTWWSSGLFFSAGKRRA